LPSMAGGPDSELGSFRTSWWQRVTNEPASYELTRFVILRLLGLVYLFAFFSLARQLEPLIGSHGLVPAGQFLAAKKGELGTGAYWRIPTLFWFTSSDAAMLGAAWLGVVLSLGVLVGVTSAPLQFALWILYSSLVHVGQIFYGYGWELQLLETGLLAVFLCPLRPRGPFPTAATPKIVIWLLRWLIFRVMLGAALIKLRNDSCWSDFTCLDYHFETQPNPGPLAWWLHHAPHFVHVAGVLFNYFVELVVPWFAFGRRRWRHAAGVCLVALQVSLILSGNLSFLNWLTIVPALACFDDTAFARLVPARWRRPLAARIALATPSRAQMRATQALAAIVALFSVAPVLNLLSCDQEMNGSFDPLAIVNTYGAFGSVDRARYEVILEGTEELGPGADWREYELPCMPGSLRRRPCVVGPYQHRLDWQMWFVGNGAARGEAVENEPWLVHLIWQLLEGEALPKRLLARDPFPDAPPRRIRAGLWQYRFSDSRADGAWWTRKRVGEFLPPLSLESAPLRDYVRAYAWPDGPADL
jgi:hypothetical protein